jgi:transposase-like protein
VPVPGAQFEETLASASPDLLRTMIREFAQRMMDADVEVACNAGYGEVTPERVNSRNGYRRREWDNVHCLIATGVNADGCREILGVDVTSSEDGAGWLAFLRGLAARGLSGVQLVTSDGHAGLVSAIAAGAARRRVAAVPDPLRRPAHPGAEVGPAVGLYPGPDHLRAARPGVGPRPACPGHSCAGGEVPGRGHASG